MPRVNFLPVHPLIPCALVRGTGGCFSFRRPPIPRVHSIAPKEGIRRTLPRSSLGIPHPGRTALHLGRRLDTPCPAPAPVLFAEGAHYCALGGDWARIACTRLSIPHRGCTVLHLGQRLGTPCLAPAPVLFAEGAQYYALGGDWAGFAVLGPGVSSRGCITLRPRRGLNALGWLWKGVTDQEGAWLCALGEDERPGALLRSLRFISTPQRTPGPCMRFYHSAWARCFGMALGRGNRSGCARICALGES